MLVRPRVVDSCAGSLYARCVVRYEPAAVPTSDGTIDGSCAGRDEELINDRTHLQLSSPRTQALAYDLIIVLFHANGPDDRVECRPPVAQTFATFATAFETVALERVTAWA